MNNNLTSNLIDNLSKDLLKNGYCIFDIENQASLELFYRNIHKKLNQNALSLLNEKTSIKDINNLKIKTFRSLNKIKNWTNEYKYLRKNLLYYFLGRDLAIQNKLEKWNLVTKTNLHMDEWKKVFEEVGYDREYEFFVPC